MAKKYLKNGWCPVISFGLVGGQSSALKLIDGFKMIINSSKFVSSVWNPRQIKIWWPRHSVGDFKTIVGHPWSTTNVSMTVDERVDSGVTEDLIRISTGTENIDGIIDDFRQSFRSSLFVSELWSGWSIVWDSEEQWCCPVRRCQTVMRLRMVAWFFNLYLLAPFYTYRFAIIGHSISSHKYADPMKISA